MAIIKEKTVKTLDDMYDIIEEIGEITYHSKDYGEISIGLEPKYSQHRNYHKPVNFFEISVYAELPVGQDWQSGAYEEEMIEFGTFDCRGMSKNEIIAKVVECYQTYERLELDYDREEQRKEEESWQHARDVIKRFFERQDMSFQVMQTETRIFARESDTWESPRGGAKEEDYLAHYILYKIFHGNLSVYSDCWNPENVLAKEVLDGTVGIKWGW